LSLKKLFKKLRYFKQAVTFSVAAFLSSCATSPSVSFKSIEKNQQIKSEIKALFLNKIPEEDFSLLDSTNLVLSAFQNLKENKFENAKKISENILYTKNLIPSIYKYAFKAYSVSMVLSINANSNKEDILKNLDFSSFQNDQCKSLCDSYGWKELARDDSFLFTPSGYNEIVLSNDIFSAIKQEKPGWLNNSIFAGEQTKLTKVDYPKLIHTSAHGQTDDLQDDALQNDKFSSILEDYGNEDEKMALSFFLKGEFKKSIELFSKIANETNDPTIKSVSYYWIGRAFTAENKFNEAKKYYLMSGSENPLGLYDSLSGQMIKSLSGRASTKELSPFPDSWEDEMVKWISYPNIHQNSALVVTALKSVILLSAQIKVENKISRIDDYQNLILSKKSIDTLLLYDQINWLAKKWENEYQGWSKQEKPDIIGNNIAWLSYVSGNYLQSIILVSKIKETLDPYSENNNFLYFLFYPRFHREEVKAAISNCNVDPDIMYAIFRQEGFFHHVNDEDDVFGKVCQLKKSLDKYKNSVVSALSAYRAGIGKTDIWLQNNLKINDDAIFMEYIPDNKIKEFVQGAMKNYYNFKWIYFTKNDLR
jgi:tetratricopeptide (TPR) repeat protein